NEDYTVLMALRAEEALDTLRMARIDLIITEALLPGMDGFEFVRHVRANDAWSQIPIIMLTVRSAPEDYAASYEAGADEYFLKPMEPPKIIAASRGLITRYEAARLSDQHGALVRGRTAGPSALPSRNQRGSIIA